MRYPNDGLNKIFVNVIVVKFYTRGIAMKKIVIAGSGGYLASNVLPVLSGAEGMLLYALSGREPAFFRENVRHFRLAMDDYGKARETIAGRCDVAINFSWIGARGKDQDEDAVQKANEENSLRLLHSLIGAGCSRFIQIGSMAEYGFVEGVITENSECNPVTAYAKRKLNCADRMRETCDAAGVKFLELRLGSVYGNHMGRENVLGYLCSEFSKGRYVKLKTSCLQDWEYTHVDDVGEILLTAVRSDVPPGIYNVTNGRTRKLRHFIRILEGKYGLSGHVGFGEINHGTGCQNIRCDIGRIRDVFGKSCFIPFEEGIDSVINAVR